MADGAGRAKLNDVALAAGVSRGTASNVFKYPDLMGDEVRECVLAAAESLGYAGPSPKGRLLRASKVNAIGIAAAEPLSYFFADPSARRLLTKVAEVCVSRGAGLALVSVAEANQLTWSIESALVDGFLLRCGRRELLVESTQRRGLPFVALSLDSVEPDVPAIDIDDVGGARKAANHLTSLGHRRIAVKGIGLGEGPGRVAPEDVRVIRFVNVRERARGYWAGLAEAGLSEAETPVHAIHNDATDISGAMSLLFESDEPPPTAHLAMSDLVALAAMDWLKARGWRVPQDVPSWASTASPNRRSRAPP